MRRDRALWAIGLLGLAVRLPFLHEPFRGDELYTFINYVRFPAAAIVRLYDNTNNHILFTLMAHALYALFGLSEFTLRLPVLAAGLLLIPLSWRFVLAVTGDKRAARLTAVLIALSHTLIYYSVFARGYGVQAAMALWLVIRVVEGDFDRPTLWNLIRLSGISFMILYCIPSGLIFILPFYLFLFLRQHEGQGPGWRSLILSALTGAALTLAAYAPLMENFRSLAKDNRYPISSGQFYSQLLEAASAGLLPELVMGALIAAGLAFHLRKPKRPAVLLLLLSYPLFAVVADAAGLPLRFFERSYVVLYPFLCAAAALGLLGAWDYCAAGLPAAARRKLAALGLALLAVPPLWSAVNVQRDPSFLFNADRAEEVDDRALVRHIAPQLKRGEIVCGANGRADALAAIYTIAERGYGFYGLGLNWRQKPPARVYVIARDEAEAARYDAQTGLQAAGFAAPRLLVARERASLFAIDAPLARP